MNPASRQQVRVFAHHADQRSMSELPTPISDMSAPYELFEANIASVDYADGREALVRRGALARRGERSVGIVSGFIVETSCGAISHIVLRRVENGRTEEEMVAVSEILRCEADQLILRSTEGAFETQADRILDAPDIV